MKILKVPYQLLEDVTPGSPHVLLKTGNATQNERWSILGWDPWLYWTPPPDGDALTSLDALIADVQSQVDTMPSDLPIPMLMGALSYDFGLSFEDIPLRAVDDVQLPTAVLYAFRQFMIADEVSKICWSVELECPTTNNEGVASGGRMRCRPAASAMLTSSPMLDYSEKRQRMGPPGDRTRSLFIAGQSNFSREKYMNTVEQIREMIANGDCYQVNLSQRFVHESEKSAQEIFKYAVQKNPASMMALVDTGEFQIVSTSPERLLKKSGSHLSSRPIKGTTPHHADPLEDQRLQSQLLESPKNRAELAMIVDLIRNDLGRVAQTGSVAVESACQLESYTNVHHLVATIVATARDDVTWGDMLRAVFPGGSITGCPKIQAMQVIEALEGVRRGFYCGSIGYIDRCGNGDWNIAIRTLTMVGHQVIFHLGGAVVYDSDPAAEYDETLSKGETLFAAVQGDERRKDCADAD